jgi:hypothetical protein
MVNAGIDHLYVDRHALMVQHWTKEIADKQLCRLVSLSDMFDQQQRAKVQFAWDITVKPLSESGCEFTNSISVFGTDEFSTFVEKSDAPPEQVRDAVQRALDPHNAEEIMPRKQRCSRR